MRGRARKLAAGALALAGFCMAGAAPVSAQAPTIVVQDGKTFPAFGYADAIRERVFIPLPGIDQDGDSVADRTTIDIIRSRATNEGLKAPAIIDPSPYYTTLGRGHESEEIADLDGDGLNDRWPLFYDNYFVPRGYAFIHAHMNGTGFSTGCPMHGGPGDVASMKAVVDWLNGRTPGFDKDGNVVSATWHNGKAAMIGKSYDGTLSNGVAATGVDGLTTIVPISAISQWYEYSRTGGIRHNNNYPGGSLAPAVTNPDRLATCAASRAAMNAADGDETGDVNQFWLDRDHLKDASKVKASVFITHGFQDDNVRFNHATIWWDALKANGVPLKMWITRTGHEDPFDFRRAHWVDTLHRWFDHWLYGLDNGIMSEPRVDIESAANTWETAADWPVPGSTMTDVFLQGTDQASAGTLGGSSGGATDTVTWTDALQNENAIVNTPAGSQANRRVFLSPVLTKPLRLSGTPVVDIQASISNPQSNLAALLVDYGPSTQVSRTSEGIVDAVPASDSTWGEASATDDAIYKNVQTLTTNVTQWRVSKGILDSLNRNSLLAPTPLDANTKAQFTFPTFPNDVVIAAGHQLGIVLVGNFTGFSSAAGTVGSVIALDTKLSKVRLPIVGGYAAAADAGLLAAETVAPVLAGMPGDIAVESPTADGIAVNYTPPTATDNEDPSPAVECTPASGSVFAVGTTTVTCTARDAHGNTASDTFEVKVTWVEEDDGDVGGEVPGTLNLSVGGPASFGAFTPGLPLDYFTTLAATVTSSAAKAKLSVADTSTTSPGHLVNGAFALPQALQAKAASAGGTGGDYAAIAGADAPAQLLAYAGPVSNDSVTIDLKQPIGATDALRTGTYGKTLTFTLSTDSP
ncbi:MAG TPA: CocE/NonD family hydrolase [Solirubrobacteraceae bacterium]|nr:CocE/NonD family hydrolase [Solirubrobacteraceae bacterium]